MRYLLLSACVLLYGLSYAQQLTPQAINAAGQSSTTAGILLESETGGFAVSSFYGTTYLYTQGVLQPDAGTTTVIPVPPQLSSTLGMGVTNAGTTSINGNIMLEFTTGEFASITLQQNNSMLTQGILQPYMSGTALPVTGLEFYARRISNTQVQLNWKTLQEINNKGFSIERKKDNEINFMHTGYVSSSTAGGNSQFTLHYQATDNNDYTGNTYYRLKQEDRNGNSFYSEVRLVKGEAGKQLTLQVWPVPAAGFFNVSVNGLDKNGLLQITDVNGRLIKKLPIQNQLQLQVNDLPAGTYFVTVAAEKTITQRVVIQ